MRGKWLVVEGFPAWTLVDWRELLKDVRNRANLEESGDHVVLLHPASKQIPTRPSQQWTGEAQQWRRASSAYRDIPGRGAATTTHRVEAGFPMTREGHPARAPGMAGTEDTKQHVMPCFGSWNRKRTLMEKLVK